MQKFNALGNIQIGKEYVVFSINPSLYPLSTVKSAALALLDKACVILDGDPHQEILVEIRSKKGQEYSRLIEEFNRRLLQDAASHQ